MFKVLLNKISLRARCRGQEGGQLMVRYLLRSRYPRFSRKWLWSHVSRNTLLPRPVPCIQVAWALNSGPRVLQCTKKVHAWWPRGRIMRRDSERLVTELYWPGQRRLWKSSWRRRRGRRVVVRSRQALLCASMGLASEKRSCWRSLAPLEANWPRLITGERVNTRKLRTLKNLDT